MSITITSSYSNPQLSVMQKFHNIYKNNVDEKSVVQKNDAQGIKNIGDMSMKDIREFLSVDEKRVLKEVFGDSNIDKNTINPYSSTSYAEILKGSQIDIRL